MVLGVTKYFLLDNVFIPENLLPTFKKGSFIKRSDELYSKSNAIVNCNAIMTLGALLR